MDNQNPNLENNLRVADMFASRYASMPLGRDKSGAPLVLATEGEAGDHNAARIRQRMDEVYGPNAAWTLQNLCDILANIDATWEFKKTLKWRVKPGYVPPAPAEAPPAPAAPTVKDTRTKAQRLQDAGITPITHKASQADMKAEQQRHQEARDKLKGLFSNDPKRAEFDRALRDANSILINSGPGVISKTKSYTAREDARKALRIKYPAFADMVVTPSGERMDHKPGVF